MVDILPAQCLAGGGCRGAETPHAQGLGLAAGGRAKPDAPPLGPGVGSGPCQPLPQREDRNVAGAE